MDGSLGMRLYSGISQDTRPALLASFPGLSPNAVEGLVKVVRRMTSGGRLEAWHFRWTAVLCMHGA